MKPNSKSKPASSPTLVFRDQLSITFTQIRGGVHLNVRTCTPLFHVSQTAGWIAFKFGLWQGIYSTCLTQVRRGKSHESYVVRCGKSTSQKSDVRCVHVHKSSVQCTCARAHPFRTMVPPRSLVHRRSQRPTGSTCSGWIKSRDRIAWFVFDLHLSQIYLHGQRVIWKTERMVTNKTGYFMVRIMDKLIETRLNLRIHVVLHNSGPPGAY